MLSICVDATGSDDPEDDIKGRIESAVEDILMGPDIPDEYSEWEVTDGCPDSRVRFGTPIYKLDVERPHVETPSKYLLMVYFVPDSDFASTFVDEDYVSIPVEMQCEADVCWPATKGLYVQFSVSEAVLDEGLKDALVLLPRTPDIDPTIDPARCMATSPPPKPPGECDYLYPP